MPDRWEWLEGIRPTALEDAIAAEMAKVIAAELRAWPPRLELDDPATAARYTSALSSSPSAAELAAGFSLARSELQHDLDAVAAARPSPMVDLIRLYLTETLYTLAEKTAHRLKRRHLVAALDRAEALTRSEPAPPSAGS